MRNSHKTWGFTLTETLAASTILCGAVMTIAAMSTQAMRNIKENRQYETAMLLLDKQLSMVDYIGIDDFADAGTLSGSFDGYDVPYQWTIVTQLTDIDGLYVVQAAVTWPGRTGTLSVSAATMFNGQKTEESTDTSQGSIGSQGSVIRGGSGSSSGGGSSGGGGG